jgi:mannose-6-phosphate isomerase-like protein (cupin superfamily)
VSDDELDGVIAAPGHHRVIFENELVRVIETTIRPGDSTPVHTHLAPQVSYVVSGSQFVRRDEHGVVMFDSHADPDYVLPRVMFSQHLSKHSIENTGPDDLRVVCVELKQHAG